MRYMAKQPADEQILKGLLDALVLDALRAGPNYGFGIREQLHRRLGPDADILKEATLYPLLHRLERNGLLASHHEPGERGSPRKYYRLTPEGRDFLQRRIHEWTRVSALLQRTLLTPGP
ncbi:PadR family transcriptional regulator [Luteimonas marina]|uniref:PadR family transcriptional regulator n=2 Tax=Luteimonas marina TaxID=488485 RepID=A0A5C5U5B9_9GAMM|nr:PadR family transcriptional regulator [Luteimonas marina]